ncbi:site-2 protease family protein, partial [Dialister invisus]
DMVGLMLLVICGFGWAKPVEINPNYYKNFRSGVMKVSFAGPGMNLLICFLAECIMLLMMKLGLLTAGQPGHLFLYWIMLYNVWFAFFNLIPVPPLDGSKILEMVLPGKLAFAFHNFSYRYSFLLLLFLVFSGMIGRIINPLAQFYTGTTIRLIASVLQM